MAELGFRIVNVFGLPGEQLSGNPLCVIEPATGLDAVTMQAIARQFNLSETVFLAPAPEATAGLRIFTPDFEMPFAGHPVLGAAAVCRALGLGGDAMRLLTPAGAIALRASGDRWTFSAPRPVWRDVPVALEELATMLGLSPADIGVRPLWVKSGKEQLLVPLKSVDAVRRCRVSATLFERAPNDEGRGSAYVFAQAGAGRISARYFFPASGSVAEDPATGSAAANLGGWWLAMRRPLPVALSIEQGELIGRPSALGLEIDAEGAVQVSGRVAEIAHGRLLI